MPRFLFWSVLIGVFALLMKIILDLDINKTVYPHTPGPCRVIPGVQNGSEDLALLKSGHVLISHGIQVVGHWEPIGEGGIYILDLSAPEVSSASKMTIIGSKSFEKEKFHPAGISVFEGEDGRIFLFAASLASQQIDVFEVLVQEKKLKHLRVIRDPLFHGVNNLVAISSNSFYVTNYVRFRSPALHYLEMSLKLPLGTVVFYDGKKAKEVFTGLKGPNGIILSPDKKILYLASTLSEEFSIFDVQNDFSLKLRKKFSLFTGLDNLNIDEEGAVWAGAHPLMYQLALHIQAPGRYSAPSQVLKFSFNRKSENLQITEVYSDSGSQLQGSTSAIRFKDRLLIGTLIDKLLLCELKHH